MVTERPTSKLGKYEILEEIGRGGFATVYRARDPDLDRDVALKVLDPLLTRDPVWVARFRREARAVARLRHPHIVTIYEIGEAEGRLYIAMELIEGPTLKSLIAQRERLPWDEAMTVLAHVADALDYAHGEGILHRDLKPGNILLDDRRGAVLTDFGFARLVGESSMSVSISGGVVGTPAYIAPEVWDGEETTSQTDLYALACIVYEMLTGEVLFAGDTPSVVMRKHLLDGPQFSTEGVKGVSQSSAGVLGQALTRKPERRVASAMALVTTLEAASGSARSVPPLRETMVPASRKVSLGQAAILGLAGVLVVFALVLAGVVGIPSLVEEMATPTLEPTDTALPVSLQLDNAPTPTTVPTLEVTATFRDRELSLDDLKITSDLDSYRAGMTISVSGTDDGKAVEQLLSFVIEYTSEPPAQHIVMSGVGTEGTEDMDSIEMYQAEGMSYIKMGEEWLSVPATEDTLDSTSFLQPEDVLEGTCGWKKQGDTKYNGVQAHHWTASKADMEKCMTDEDLAEFGEIRGASGELYTAIEGNYVVHLDMVFEGQNLQVGMDTTDQMLDTGRMEITFEMTDVNKTFVIEVPDEAVVSSSLPEDIPVPDDAQDVANAFGMITFSSPSTPAEVSGFYRAGMPLNGWMEVSVDEMSGMFMLEYSKGGRRASLMITTDEDTGLTSVLITVQEE